MSGLRYVAVLVLFGAFCLNNAAPVVQGSTDLGQPILRISDIPLKSIDARLFKAIRAGDPTKVDALLRKGADANAQDEQNTTALELATDSPKHPLQILQLLLSHGANINYRGLSGGSTLLMSVMIHRASNQTLIKYLLDHRARVNDPNFNGETPLSLAVRAGSVETVALLLKRGANPNPPMANPLASIVFQDGGQGPGFNGFGNTPVFEMLQNWDPKIFDLLASAGADLKAKDEQGFNLFHYAVLDHDIDAIQLLAAKGVDVNAASKRGYTALHFALVYPAVPPDPQTIRALLRAGADPSLKTKQGKTPQDLLREFIKDDNSAGLWKTLLKELDPAATPSPVRK